MRCLKFVFILFFSSVVSAQHDHPRCVFDSIHQHDIESIGYQLRQIEENGAFQKYMKRTSRRGNTTYTIPVVVHIVKNESNTDMNISDEDVYRQIDILNAAYSASNSDLTNTPEYFQSDIGSSSIEFCLATVDPNGYATNGITRNTTDVSSFSSVLDNIKHAQEGGVDAWDQDSYLNIWVGKITSSVLGYSYAPNKTVTISKYPIVHGVVIAYPYFGENNHPKYNMGKTTVHEVGHYFNLMHPWGRGSGGCDEDDLVEDTPVSEKAYYDTPIHPQVSCESTDMFMNYMEYVNDSVMVMFSNGQVDRMHFALEYYPNRKSLLQSNGCGTPDLIAKSMVKHASSDISDDAAIYLDIVSGVPPYTIEWNNGAQTDSLFNLSMGDYSVQITDASSRQLDLNFSVSYYGELYDSDNFETYSPDSLLYTQSHNWTAFCADTFSANIASINAPEGSQYLEVKAFDGLNSFSRNLGELDDFAFDLSFQMYVPSGRSAAYTIYHESTCSDPLAAYELQFNDDGIGFLKTGGVSTSFEFPVNRWFTIHQLIDMDRDLVSLTVANVTVADWNYNWSVDAEMGNSKLSAIVFEDQVDSLTNVHYYIDDFQFKLSENNDVGILEMLNDIPVTLYPNPARSELNLSIQEDAVDTYDVILFNSLGQSIEEFRWHAQNNQQMKVSVDHLNRGVYLVSIKSKTKHKVLKFIVN